MTISVVVPMVVLGFNLGLVLMPFLLSWTLTLNVSTVALLIANIATNLPIRPLEFALAWVFAFFGTVQASTFLRATIDPRRMLTFWHYGNFSLKGHLRTQYFEIVIRGGVALVYIVEGIFFVIVDMRTITLLAVRIAVNVIIMVMIFIYFQLVFYRPTVAQFYLAMMLTSALADLGIIVIAAAVGETATFGMVAIFIGVHLLAWIVTLIVTAIRGSAYNRLRLQGGEQDGSERLYPVFQNHQLYAPSLWLYMPAWFRSSPHPITYADGVEPTVDTSHVIFSDNGGAGHNAEEDDTSVNSLYDPSTIEIELSAMSASADTSVHAAPSIEPSFALPQPQPSTSSPLPPVAKPKRTVRFVSRTGKQSGRSNYR